MKLLLDTHAFLWWVMNDPRLSSTARAAIADSASMVYVSAATGWEIAIKAGMGRLKLPYHAKEFVPQQIEINRFEVLPIALTHGLAVHDLPLLHRDPFDRLLVIQAQIEGLRLVTDDGLVQQYQVDILW